MIQVKSIGEGFEERVQCIGCDRWIDSSLKECPHCKEREQAELDAGMPLEQLERGKDG